MEIDIRTLLSRLNPACKHAMEQAAQLCVRQTHFSVDIEHLLLMLLETDAPDLRAILAHFGVERSGLIAHLEKTVELFKRGNGRTPSLSPNLSPLFQEAWLLSSMLLGEQQVRSGTLTLALLEVDSLRGLLLESAPMLLKIPRAQLREGLRAILAGSAEDAGAPAGGGAAPAQAASDTNTPAAPPGASRQPAMPSLAGSAGSGMQRALDLYAVDLTALAREGAIDPIHGRDGEIRQLIDVLLRRRQNNPILTGEAGVGKTAVVEGLAQRIVQGEVPPALADVSVRSLDLALLQAGAGVKGEFESRLKSVIAEVKASPVPVILFIDEAHQLIGAGGSEGQGDAANLLKPALARGELRTIAATTWAEYKKYVERDPALARRFQVVKVEEPSEPVAVEMLRGMVAKLEAHHGVEILDDAVRDAVRLSHRYISGRQLPDKAISVLDTACARVAIGQSGVPEEIEALGRSIGTAENQLRILRHEAATGAPRDEETAATQRHLQEQRERHARLADKFATEKRAVDEILAWRRRIAAHLSSPSAGMDRDLSPGADHEDIETLTATLHRLEKGLEAVQNDEPMVPVCVDSGVVAEVISGWTGIPVGRMLADELHTVLHLQERLAERVVGQGEALDTIARRVRTFRADLDDPGKPVGVFMLVGPSGVGKTETAYALAELLYGGERNVITVNLSEFQEAHSVSGLKGAPPGYVGYGRGGVLTEAVRRRPYSVVLLDEMEKAHPDVLELFFQVFDKGIMEDGEGVPIDFKNTLILLTSNAAQDIITDACQGGRRPAPQALVERLRPPLLRQFSRAFLGRLALVPYYPLDAATIIGQTVTVTLHSPGGPTRYFSGIVVRFAHAGTDAQHGFYSAELAPRMWLLTLGRDRAIHQHKSAPEIVKEVLDAAAVPYELRLSGTGYAQREYCVQYDESPFAFISRLMEEEGIFYFFTFANGAHTLVLADSAAAHHADAASAQLHFPTDGRASGDLNRVRAFEMAHRLVAHDHVLGDYDFTNAAATQTGTATSPPSAGRRYTFPGKYADAADGARKAAVRRAAHEAAQQTGSGECDCYSLAAGTRFTLAGHPGGAALNTGYVVRAVTHDASHRSYGNRFEALPQATPFRAPLATPLPVVAGTHTAKVAGLAGEEIWTDSYGRVKLKFHWDTTPDANQDSSCWVRVQQASAGNGWGVLFLPRVGQEVVVSYVDGDPDRPLVTGAVYNGQNAVPVELPGSHTQSVLRSRSSKNGTAGNEIRMEDRLGAEELYLHAQRDMNVAIEQALTTTVLGGAESHVVKRGDRSIDVQTGNESHTVKGQRSVETGGDETHTNHASYTHQTHGDHTLRVSGNLVIDVSGSVTIRSGAAFALKSGAAFAAEAATSFGQKAGTSLTVEGLTIEHKASAAQTVDGGGMLALKGGLVKLN